MSSELMFAIPIGLLMYKQKRGFPLLRNRRFCYLAGCAYLAHSKKKSHPRVTYLSQHLSSAPSSAVTVVPALTGAPITPWLVVTGLTVTNVLCGFPAPPMWAWWGFPLLALEKGCILQGFILMQALQCTPCTQFPKQALATAAPHVSEPIWREQWSSPECCSLQISSFAPAWVNLQAKPDMPHESTPCRIIHCPWAPQGMPQT